MFEGMFTEYEREGTWQTEEKSYVRDENGELKEVRDNGCDVEERQ